MSIKDWFLFVLGLVFLALIVVASYCLGRFFFSLPPVKMAMIAIGVVALTASCAIVYCVLQVFRGMVRFFCRY